MTAYDPARIAAVRQRLAEQSWTDPTSDVPGTILDHQAWDESGLGPWDIAYLLSLLGGAEVEYAIARVKPSIHHVILRDIGKPYWPTADAARSDFPPLGDEGVVCRLATPWMEVIE